LAVAQKLFDKKDRLTGLGVRVKDLTELDTFVDDIYDLPSVQVIATAQIQGTLLKLVDSMRSVMLSIGVCAALIAAVALINTVLMSVFERTREFGVMRALGGGVGHLFAIVCLETLFLTLLGSILGNGLIIALRGTAEYAVRELLPFTPGGHILRIGWMDQMGAVVFATLAGVLCGLYPAFRASRVRPQQTLRYGE
jgi:putative ABC transport system permease protein